MPVLAMNSYASVGLPPLHEPVDGVAEAPQSSSACGDRLTSGSRPPVAILIRSLSAPVAANAQHEPHGEGISW